MGITLKFPLVFSLFLSILILPSVVFAAGTPTITYDLSLLSDSETNIFGVTQFTNNTGLNPKIFYIGYRSLINSSAWINNVSLFSNGTVRSSPMYSWQAQNDAGALNMFDATMNGACNNFAQWNVTRSGLSNDGSNLRIMAYGRTGSTCSGSIFSFSIVPANTTAFANFMLIDNKTLSIGLISHDILSLTDDGLNYYFTGFLNDTLLADSIYPQTQTPDTAQINRTVTIFRINSAGNTITQVLHNDNDGQLQYVNRPNGWSGFGGYPVKVKSLNDDANNPRLFILENLHQSFNLNGVAACTREDVGGGSDCPYHQYIAGFKTSDSSMFFPTPTDLSSYLGSLGTLETIIGVTNPDKIIVDYEPDVNNVLTRGYVFMANQTAYLFDFTAAAPTGTGGGTGFGNTTGIPSNDTFGVGAVITGFSTAIGIEQGAGLLLFGFLLALVIAGWIAYKFGGKHSGQIFGMVFLGAIIVETVIGWIPAWVGVVFVVVAGAIAVKWLTSIHGGGTGGV